MRKIRFATCAVQYLILQMGMCVGIQADDSLPAADLVARVTTMDKAELVARRAEVIAAYEAAPTNWTSTALMDLARCYIANGNIDKAQLLYMRLANDSTNTSAMVNLGQ